MMYSHSQSGFSLVETLVAITILLIVIVGPMSIVTSSAKSTSFASEQVVAFFLAQEGAELAQKARDDILLNGFLPDTDGSYDADPWATFTDTSGTGIYQQCFDAGGCGLEIDTDSSGSIKTPLSCAQSGGASCTLYLNVADGNVRSRYTHTSSGNTGTVFKRQIYFTNTSAYGVQVISRVSWFTGSSAKAQEVEVESYLFDVYGN